jgi:DNA-binding response OmpR family regulator
MVNIFIAEDDNDDFQLLTEAIETVLPKFTTNLSKDGKAFMKSLDKEAKPDLIFLDLNIPKKNGIDCLIELRQQKRLASVPVIIYSTSSDVEDIDQCYLNGCTLYLVKPTSFHELIIQIKKIFFRIGLPRKDLLYKEMFVVSRQQEKLPED